VKIAVGGDPPAQASDRPAVALGDGCTSGGEVVDHLRHVFP
jgi:hypothetical protein